MFQASQKSTGTGYTTTVAFLLAALVFSPAVLIVSRPLEYVSVSLAIASIALCITLEENVAAVHSFHRGFGR